MKEFTNSVESGMAAPEAGHFETGNGNANWRQSKCRLSERMSRSDEAIVSDRFPLL